MSLSYIRQHYGVPAKRGARITFYSAGAGDRHGTIIGALNGWLRVRFDDQKRTANLHPTWCVTYDNNERVQKQPAED